MGQEASRYDESEFDRSNGTTHVTSKDQVREIGSHESPRSVPAKHHRHSASSNVTSRFQPRQLEFAEEGRRSDPDGTRRSQKPPGQNEAKTEAKKRKKDKQSKKRDHQKTYDRLQSPDHLHDYVIRRAENGTSRAFEQVQATEDEANRKQKRQKVDSESPVVGLHLQKRRPKKAKKKSRDQPFEDASIPLQPEDKPQSELSAQGIAVSEKKLTKGTEVLSPSENRTKAVVPTPWEDRQLSPRAEEKKRQKEIRKRQRITEGADKKGEKHTEKQLHNFKKVVSIDESKASPFDSSSIASSDLGSKTKIPQSERAKLHSMLLAAVQGRGANLASRNDTSQGEARSSKPGESESSMELDKYLAGPKDVKERDARFEQGEMGIMKVKKKKKKKKKTKLLQKLGNASEERIGSLVADQVTAIAANPSISPELKAIQEVTNINEDQPKTSRDSPKLPDSSPLSQKSPIASQAAQDDLSKQSHENESQHAPQASTDHEQLKIDADASRARSDEEQGLSQVLWITNSEAPVPQLPESTTTSATQPTINQEAEMQTKHREPSPADDSTAANSGFVLDAIDNPIADSNGEHQVTTPMIRASSMELDEPTRTDQAYAGPGPDDGQFFRDALMDDTPLVQIDDAYATVDTGPSLDEQSPSDILARPFAISLNESARQQQNMSPELVARAVLEHLQHHTFSGPPSISSQQDIESGSHISEHHATEEPITHSSHLALGSQGFNAHPVQCLDAPVLQSQLDTQSRPGGLSWSIDEYEAILDAAAKYLSSMPSNRHKGITVESLRSTMDDNPSLSQWFTEMERAGIDFDRDQLTRLLSSVAPCASLGVSNLDTVASGTQTQSHENNDHGGSDDSDKPSVTKEASSKELVFSYLSDQLLLHPTKGLLPCLQAFQVQEICRELGISLSSASDSVDQAKPSAKPITEISPEQLAVSHEMSAIDPPDAYTPVQDLQPRQSVESLAPEQETTVGGADSADTEPKSSLRRSQRLAVPSKRQTSVANGISSPHTRRSRVDAPEPESNSQHSALVKHGLEVGVNQLQASGSDTDEVDTAANAQSPGQELEQGEEDEEDEDDIENTFHSQIKKIEDLNPGETFSLSKNGIVTIRVSVSDSPSERAYVQCAKHEVLKGITKELERSGRARIMSRERQDAGDIAARFVGDGEGIEETQYNEVRLQVRHPIKPQDGKCRRCCEIAKRWYFDSRDMQWICARCYNKRWRAEHKLESTNSFYPNPWPPRPKTGRCEHCREVPQKWCFIISLRQWTCKGCYNVQRDKASPTTGTVGFAGPSWSQKLREALGEENSIPEDALLLLELRDEQQRSFEWIQSYLAKRGQVETVHVLSKRYQRLKCWIVDLLQPSGSECSEGDSTRLEENHGRERPLKPQNGMCQQCSRQTMKWYYRGNADDIQWICTGCYNKNLRARRRPPGVLPPPPRSEKPEDGKCQRCCTLPYKWYFDTTSHEWICKRCYSSDRHIKKIERQAATPNSRNTKKPADGRCQQCSTEPGDNKWYFAKREQQWQCARCYEHQRYESRTSALRDEMGGSLRKLRKQFQATATEAGQVECFKPTMETVEVARDHAEAREDTEASEMGAEVFEADDNVSAEEDEDFSEDDLLLLQLREEERRSWPEIQAIFEKRGMFESVGIWKTRHQELRERVDTM